MKLTSLEKVAELIGHTDRVWSVSWNPTGTLLASCSADKTVRIWGKVDNSWNSLSVLTAGHMRTVRSVSWSPCGNYLASGSFDSTTCIWDRRGGEFECIATLEGHENEVKSVAWSSSGQFLATCSRDKSVWVWEVGEDNEYECASVLNCHSQDVKRVLWHPLKDILVSCGYDDTIKFYKEDADDWVVFDTLHSHESTVWAVAFNSVGNLLASCSDDKTVKIWKEYLPGNEEGVRSANGDPAWKCISTLSGHHERPIFDVSWCALSDSIATACGDNCLRVFQESKDCDLNAPLYDLVATVRDAHEQDINCVNWNPKISGLLASGSDDNSVKLWSMPNHNF